MKNSYIFSVVVLFCLIFVQACGGSGGDGDNPLPANMNPTSNAGVDQTVNEKTTVTLYGSGGDSDGTITSYSWTQTAGVIVSLTTDFGAVTSFFAPTTTEQLTLTFQLTIIDDANATATDTINIFVSPVNIPPTSDAGEDQTVEELTTVTLTGEGVDSDGSIADYSWTQITGITVTLANADSKTATFTTPDIDIDEILTFSLMITDNEGSTAVDSVDIVVALPSPPNADAGSAQFKTSGTSIILDASASTSPSGADLTFNWIQIDGSGLSIKLDDSSIVGPSFTAPELTAARTVIFEVTVSDNVGLSDSAIVNIGIAPIITQKLNDTGILLCGDYVWLDKSAGSNSENCDDDTDADGDPIPNGQDADTGRDVTANDGSDGKSGFSFTKLDVSGKPLPISSETWSCVLDNVTKLIWETKTADGGLQHNGNTYTSYNPDGRTNAGNSGTQNGGVCNGSNCDTYDYVNSINTLKLCGFDNWKMPSFEQLNSIVDYSVASPGPTIDNIYFPNTKSDWYWSSSVDSESNGFSSKLWGLYFDNGESLRGEQSTSSGYIRLVGYKQ